MIDLVEYETRAACMEALGIARRHFRLIESFVPPARWVPWQDAHNWRFVEQHHEQLLLQKLARQITGAETVDLLLMAGFLQEIGVIYRTLDEIEEDILFVVLGIRTGKWTPHHDAYVSYFWSEDDANKQPPVRRKAIRAYVNRALGQPDPARGDAVGREIHKTYSDYIHARSAPIMGMVKGPPARFDLDGIHHPEARYPYVHQNPTYFYRCLISATAIANVVLADEDRAKLFSDFKAFEHKHHDLLF